MKMMSFTIFLAVINTMKRCAVTSIAIVIACIMTTTVKNSKEENENMQLDQGKTQLTIEGHS
jgi:hypothetical protein